MKDANTSTLSFAKHTRGTTSPEIQNPQPFASTQLDPNKADEAARELLALSPAEFQ